MNFQGWVRTNYANSHENSRDREFSLGSGVRSLREILMVQKPRLREISRAERMDFPIPVLVDILSSSIFLQGVDPPLLMIGECHVYFKMMLKTTLFNMCQKWIKTFKHCLRQNRPRLLPTWLVIASLEKSRNIGETFKTFWGKVEELECK